MLLTLGECKNDRGIRSIINVPPSSIDFAEKVNAACRKILRRGDFDGTVLPIHVCVRKNCVVWPRYVEQVRKLNLCQNRPMPVNNLWYEFMDRGSSCCNDSFPDWRARFGAINKGYSPVYNDIFGEGRYVRVYHQLDADRGKKIRIFGLDNNGQPLRSPNGDGTFSDGLVMIMALPYAQSPMFIRQVDRVVKDETQGNITMFAYDPVAAVLEDMAVYEPSETNPSYERQLLQFCGCSTDCSTSTSISALVKLKFIPAKYDTDLVYIQNLDALKLFIQSVNFGEAGDRQSAIGYEQDGIRELNLDLYNRDGENIPVNMGELGNTDIGRQACF